MQSAKLVESRRPFDDLASRKPRLQSNLGHPFPLKGVSIAGHFYIQVSKQGETLHESERFEESVELGRQDQPRAGVVEPLFEKIRFGEHWRFVISRGNEDTHIHRHHLLIEPVRAGIVKVGNIGQQNPVGVLGREFLQPQQSGEFPLPVKLQLRDIAVDVTSEQPEQFQSLSYRSIAPRAVQSTVSPSPLPMISAGFQRELEEVGSWLANILGVLQIATGENQFYEQAARALVENARMDRGAVLLKTGDNWTTRVCYPPQADDQMWAPSKNMLRHMERERKTISERFQGNVDMFASTMGVRQVIVAPILGTNDVIKGALYGDRRSAPHQSKTSPLELVVVDLLAAGVANGIARLEIEAEAIQARQRFVSFFGHELADELARNEKLLEGKDAEVSLLFADVKSFSAVTEKLGAVETMKWMSDVLSALSQSVMDHGGIVVDFIGDELFAMFGAPKAQPDHAKRAVRAALDMHARLATIDETWQPVCGRRTELAVGINTGTTRVGNTGSLQRYKYGAIGPDVNLASRVRGATKYLHADLVVTQTTAEQLGDEFKSRRLCRVRVVNINRSIDLHEIFVHPPDDWQKLKAWYENALRMFEDQNFREAARELGVVLNLFRDDGPSLQLLSRAINVLVDPNSDRSPVWTLPGK